jgi:hypothetical protein
MYDLLLHYAITYAAECSQHHDGGRKDEITPIALKRAGINDVRACEAIRPYDLIPVHTSSPLLRLHLLLLAASTLSFSTFFPLDPRLQQAPFTSSVLAVKGQDERRSTLRP